MPKFTTGFALLFAILASSVLLSIGLAIWSIAFREVLLSSFGRESQGAFYVADSGIECGLYEDFIGSSVFATSTDYFILFPGGYDNYKTLDCGGSSSVKISIYKPSSVYQIDGRNATSTFTINYGSGKATVFVGKSDPNGTSRSATIIISHGQNTVDSANPTLVERGLRTTY